MPIKRVDVFRSVVAQLDAVITDSDLRPGDRLGSERELAEKLQVSRVSVREALRALESMGKIEIRRNAGSFVVDPDGTALTRLLKSFEPLDEGFIKYLVDVREAMETKVVALIALQPEADLTSIAELTEQIGNELQAAQEGKGSLDVRFEAALGREAGNPVLARFQRAVHQLWIDAAIELGVAYGDRAALHEEHVGILSALQARDGDRAVALMAQHIQQVKWIAQTHRAGNG